MNARLKLNLDRLTGTFDVDPSSSRIYSRDAAIDLIVHGFDENEVTPANEGGATPPGKPVVQFVNSAGRVVAQAMLAQPTGDGSGAGADGKYDLVATLSTNTVEMRREFFRAGPQAVREFTVRILDTATANPIACGPFPVFNFPGVCGDAPTELPSASKVLAELRRMIEEHAGRTDNPHAVTAALISALTQTEADARYALKASVTTLSGQVAQAVQQSVAAVVAMRQHTNRSDNPHGVTAAQVGLGNVDNTADADKPVSTRQQTAIATAKEQVANLVRAEARRATDREQELHNEIDEEGRRAASAETDLGRAIRTEKERAQGAEAALGSTKQDKLSSRQLVAVNSGIDASKVAKIAQNESAISSEVSRATTEEARLQALINAIKTFEAVVADSLPIPSEQYSKKLYLIPSTNPETRNVKDEFICVKIENVWGWEHVGSTAITIEFDNEPTEGSQKAVRSGGIWSWVKSLLPKWLTSDYAEPATVESVKVKADKATTLAGYGITDAVPLVEDASLEKTAVTIGSRADGGSVGVYSLADGAEVTASGEHSHAEGGGTTAFGPYSHAEGITTTASGENSHAEGKGTTASDEGSHAEGERTTASGAYSHAEGGGTTAFGRYSHAEGASTIAAGYGSHAEGIWSETREEDAIAFVWNGDDTISSESPYTSNGPGTFNINPKGGLDGFWIGEQTLPQVINAAIAGKANHAALAPEYSAASAYSVGAIVYYRGNIYQCKTAIAAFSEEWNAEHWELMKLSDFFTESNSLLTGTIDARLPYPLYAVPSTGLLKDRAINTTSLASVTVPDNFTDLLVRASVASSLAVTMPTAITTVYGDTFPSAAGEYLVTITKTGAAEAYVRTIKLEVANA